MLTLKPDFIIFLNVTHDFALIWFGVVLIFFSSASSKLGPNVSGKELALKLDKLMKPGESIEFYLKARFSFLFYSDRRAELLNNPQELKDYINSGHRVYCVFKHDDWEDVENLHGAMQIVAQVGDKLIVTNKRSDL